jgi:hypothetical protein
MSSGDFRYWEAQEEKYIEKILANCKLYAQEGKSTTSVEDGRGYTRKSVVAPFCEIGKDETDGYKAP